MSKKILTDEYLKPKLLYENSDGAGGSWSSVSLTMSDDLNNYNFVVMKISSNGKSDFGNVICAIIENEIRLIGFQMANENFRYITNACTFDKNKLEFYMFSWSNSSNNDPCRVYEIYGYR